MKKFTHQSPLAQGHLEAAARAENIPFRKLKNPGETRWSSQHDTMESVLHLKDAIKKLFDENDDWADKTIDRAEWKLIEGAVEILKPIRETIKAFEGEKEPTMHRVLERLYHNHYLLNKFINNRNHCNYGIGFARSLKRNIEKRSPNKGMEVQERRFANYLAPQFKGVHLLTENRLQSTKDEIEAASNKLDNVEEDNAEQEDSDSDNNVELSPTSKLMKQSQARFDFSNRRNLTKIRIEMEKFEVFSMASKDVDILQWWKKHESVLPLLARIAKRVLAIPASSAKSERVFSTGGNIVTAKRNRTASKKVEALILIKENQAKIDAFKKNSGYEIVLSDKNPFQNVIQVGDTESPLASSVFDDDLHDDLIILESDSDNDDDDYHYDM